MATYLSAGVNVLEQDASQTVAAPSTSVAAYVGRAVKGPVKQPILITNENDYVTVFGKPNEVTYEDFFTVAGFLQYGSAIYFVRELNEAIAKNADISVDDTTTFPGSGIYIQDWEEHADAFAQSQKFKFTAKYPGIYGNTEFKVGLINFTDYEAGLSISTTLSGYSGNIEYGPSDTDEYIVIVSTLDADGINYSVAEVTLVSDDPTAKDSQGNSIYIEQIINRTSKYILAFNNSAITTEAISFIPTFLTGGDDGGETVDSNGAAATFDESDILTGYDLFHNPEEIEINYLLGGSHTAAATEIYIQAIADARGDCFAIYDVPYTDVNDALIANNIANVIDFRKNEMNINSSYGGLYANWLYIKDKYNSKNRWIPCSGHVAGVYAHTADVSDSWFAPAGLNRGVLRNVIKLKINPNKAYRDQLYQAQINPIVSFPGQGLVIWGQKTLQTKSGVFSRVQGRLLFLYMEKAISRAAKSLVFEQNDELTRAIFVNMVVPFLSNIKGRRGIQEFLVDVGPTVNTPERVDNYEFWAKIIVSPTRAAENIVLVFTAARTGVDFTELVG